MLGAAAAMLLLLLSLPSSSSSLLLVVFVVPSSSSGFVRQATGFAVGAGAVCYPGEDYSTSVAGSLWVQPAHDELVFPSSCFDLLRQNPAAPNGVYRLTSLPSSTTYSAYCDMANGGWELAMRVAADGSEFVFDSDYWENDELLNESSFDPSLASDDAKYATFTHASVGFLRGCFNGDTTAGKCNTHALPQEYASLSKMFSDVTIGIDGVAGGITFDDLTEAEHYQWLTNMGLDVDYCLEDTSGGTTMLWYAAGINLDDTTSLYDCRVRYGFMHNNQNSIYTANDAFGFGAQEVRACVRVWEREVAFVLERIYFECSATSLTAAVTD